jgi:hypothetical protein
VQFAIIRVVQRASGPGRITGIPLTGVQRCRETPFIRPIVKISISGTLKEFEYTNPHCWLHISVADAGTGRTVDWSFEMGSIGQIAQQGWKIDTVKPGDKITVEGYPMKDGSRGGQYLSARLGDGRVFNQGATPNPAAAR